jgi:predicted dehydrogenase
VVREFVEKIRAGERSADGEHAAQLTRVVEESYRSAREQREIRIADPAA